MILVFSKYPIPGQVKTRMIPAIGPEGAARLHRRLTESVVASAKHSGDTVTICATSAPLRRFRAWLGPDIQYTTQPTGDLGNRMEHAFAAAFRRGAARVIAVGADAPDLTPDILRKAFLALDSSDVVVGPAADGGYYLIGMTRLRPELFHGLEWGTEKVLSRTRDAIRRLGLKADELPVLQDVDRPEDLARVRNDPMFADALIESPLLSVIIPTLNEESVIGATLACARAARNVEIIVADGGSHDRTRALAQAAGATVLRVDSGRAAQLNAGAARAGGQRLLFLHADTHVPAGYERAIHEVLDEPSIVLGAFRFKTDMPGAGMRIVEWGAHVRSRFLRWPYGDQGLFLERRMFDEIGGFGALRIMEDFDLARRLRRRGRVTTLSLAAVTSGRRWRKLGLWRVWSKNLIMIIGYFLGVSNDALDDFYRDAVED